MEEEMKTNQLVFGILSPKINTYSLNIVPWTAIQSSIFVPFDRLVEIDGPQWPEKTVQEV